MSTTATNSDIPTVVLAHKERPSTSSTTEVSEVAAPISNSGSGLEEDSAMTMTALADKISRETAKLEKYLKENGLPMPGFGVDAADDFPRLPDEMQKSRLEIIHATKLLRDLAVGPREGVRWGVQQVSSSQALFSLPLLAKIERERKRAIFVLTKSDSSSTCSLSKLSTTTV